MTYITIIMAWGMREPGDEFDTEIAVAAFSDSAQADEVLGRLASGEVVEGVEEDGMYVRHGYVSVTVPNLTV